MIDDRTLGELIDAWLLDESDAAMPDDQLEMALATCRTTMQVGGRRLPLNLGSWPRPARLTSVALLVLLGLVALVTALQLAGAPPTPPPPTVPTLSSGSILYQDYSNGWIIAIAPTALSSGHEIAGDVAGDHLAPAWSPDGTRVLFTADRSGAAELFEYTIETGLSQPITTCSQPCRADREGSYSPDGRSIAFVRELAASDENGAGCALMVLDRPSGAIASISQVRACADRDRDPRWSPDGSEIAFWRERQEAGNDVPEAAILTMGREGGSERQITDWSLNAGDPDWAPDGKQLAFDTFPLFSFQGPSFASNIHVVRPDGTDDQALTTFAHDVKRATQPRWTPNGEGITFTLSRDDNGALATHLQLLSVMDRRVSPIVLGTHVAEFGSWQAVAGAP
jgi:Tol biopolymer transport system component